jgi:hypothetical protein
MFQSYNPKRILKLIKFTLPTFKFMKTEVRDLKDPA